MSKNLKFFKTTKSFQEFKKIIKKNLSNLDTQKTLGKSFFRYSSLNPEDINILSSQIFYKNTLKNNLIKLFLLRQGHTKNIILKIFSHKCLQDLISFKILKKKGNLFYSNFAIAITKDISNKSKFFFTDALQNNRKDYIFSIAREQNYLLDVCRIAKIKKHKNILDICSGSGCLGYCTVTNKIQKITNIEINPRAREISEFNKSLNDIKNENILFDDANKFLDNLPKDKYDLIISNPPYNIDISNKKILPLSGGKYGHNILVKILNSFDKILKQNSLAFIVSNWLLKDNKLSSIYNSKVFNKGSWIFLHRSPKPIKSWEFYAELLSVKNLKKGYLDQFFNKEKKSFNQNTFGILIYYKGNKNFFKNIVNNDTDFELIENSNVKILKEIFRRI